MPVVLTVVMSQSGAVDAVVKGTGVVARNWVNLVVFNLTIVVFWSFNSFETLGITVWFMVIVFSRKGLYVTGY